MHRRPVSPIAAALAMSLLLAAAASAQRSDTVPAAPTPRALRVLVEYIGGANLYLAAGRESGLAANDTIDVRGARGKTMGRVRVVSSAEGRSVVAFAGAAFPVTRGDSLTLLVPLPLEVAGAKPDSALAVDSAGGALPRRMPSPVTRSGGDAAVPARAPGQARRPPPRTARLDGSFSFDVDALTSRAEDSSGSRGDPWRFVTPSVRLYATASELPGGTRITVNGTWAQYYSSGNLGPGRSGQVRLYQADFEKVFARAPVQFRAGRFLERHDIWGGYLDGAALRLGGTGNGPGLGVSAGVSPVSAEQDLFSGAQRFAVFADYRHRGTAFGYDMDMAFSQRTRSGAAAERYVGLTQRFRFGSASLYQRARVDLEAATGSPDLSQLDLMGTLPLGAGWMVRGQYSRRSFDWISGSGVTAVQRRERAGGGLSWSGSAGSLSLDAQAMRWADRPVSPVYSGSLYLPRLIAGFLGFSINGSMNRDPVAQSAYLAPGLLVQAGGLRAEASWRAYRTTTASFESTTQGTSFLLSLPLRRGLQATVRGDFQNGGGSTSQRLYTGLWAAF